MAIAALAACAAPPPSPDCPAPVDVTHLQLLGAWRAEVQGEAAATLVLEKHPVYGESVRGTIDRAGRRAEVAGDIDEGDFTLEESSDGRQISATWLGEPTESSCGREIRGTWKAEGEALAKPFVMRRMPGN